MQSFWANFWKGAAFTSAVMFAGAAIGYAAYLVMR